MHLFSIDGREPLQEFVYGRALIEVFEKRGNRQSSTTETPRSAKLTWASVDSAAKGPVHIPSLSETSHFRPAPFAFRNVPLSSSSNASRNCSCVFITIGPYQATGSLSG